METRAPAGVSVMQPEARRANRKRADRRMILMIGNLWGVCHFYAVDFLPTRRGSSADHIGKMCSLGYFTGTRS
jgi:hypothetical protein